MFTQLYRVSEPNHDLHRFQRQVDALFSAWDRPRHRPQPRSEGPAFDVFDDGAAFRLVADVPGLRAEDLEVEVTEDGLTVRGARTQEVPEGFTVHRRERRGLELSRTFELPAKLDPESVTATLVQGVLTITLGKRVDAKPRTITVSAA